MLRAISTKFLNPTNKLGSRVKAIARKRDGDMPEISFTDHWDHGGSIEENHCRVAKLLAAKMKWPGLYIGGGTDEGFCFVNAGNDAEPSEFAISDRDTFFIPRQESQS